MPCRSQIFPSGSPLAMLDPCLTAHPSCAWLSAAYVGPGHSRCRPSGAGDAGSGVLLLHVVSLGQWVFSSLLLLFLGPGMGRSWCGALRHGPAGLEPQARAVVGAQGPDAMVQSGSRGMRV